MNTLYVLTSPSGKVYVGVTTNFKRRMKEHHGSKYLIGKAIHKYKFKNFKVRLFKFDTIAEAYIMEALLIGQREVESDFYYNQVKGGGGPTVYTPELLDRFKNSGKISWETRSKEARETSYNNVLEYRKKRSHRVQIDGICFSSVSEAARYFGLYKLGITHRLKSPNFPNYIYV